MSLYSLEEALDKVASHEALDPAHFGVVWASALDAPWVSVEDQLSLRLFGIPYPEAYRYFEHGDREFCWNTRPLTPRWFYPFRWVGWVQQRVEEGGDIYLEREPDSVRFADLRREAKDHAEAWWTAARSEG